MLRKTFGWETEKWDLRQSAKTKANSFEKAQLERLGEEEEEPAKERKREYTDSGLDLGEREKQVACDVSALALALTDIARREAKM